MTVGALLADVPHTRPVRLTGMSTDQDLARRAGFATSTYEGPTGIVGVLVDALRQADLPAATKLTTQPLGALLVLIVVLNEMPRKKIVRSQENSGN